MRVCPDLMRQTRFRVASDPPFGDVGDRGGSHWPGVLFRKEKIWCNADGPSDSLTEIYFKYLVPTLLSIFTRLGTQLAQWLPVPAAARTTLQSLAPWFVKGLRSKNHNRPSEELTGTSLSSVQVSWAEAPHKKNRSTFPVPPRMEL